MCLLFYCQNAHPEFRVILLANRDEFYQRPTHPADFWPEQPTVLAGRDLLHGGTWLGITRAGRWAALTNYREPSNSRFSRSRGSIVHHYLSGSQSAREFAQDLRQLVDKFDGFNLLLGDRIESLWLSNRGDREVHALDSGIYGLSNHLLETPWPKVNRGKEILRARMEGSLITDQLFEPLAEQTVYEENLPHTGADRDTERMLSSAFISSPDYGTRSSSLVLLDGEDSVYFEERSYDNPTSGSYRPDEYRSKIFRFRLDSAE